MDAIQEAGKLYKEALDATRDQRRQIEEDLAFTDASDPQQWEDDVKRQRETDPGGIRPCLVFDQIGQYIQNVTGNIEQQPPSMHALPVDGGADRKVAEQLDGFFRHIEYSSKAQQHYMTAEMSAARAGVGYLIVRPEYVNRALNWQEPRISSEGDPLRVVFDPWSVALDGADATFGFLLTPYSHREFERRWPGKDKVSFGAEEQQRVRDERESILVAEGWTVDEATKNMVVVNLDGDRMALSEDDYWLKCQQMGMQIPVEGTYKDKVCQVKWARMSGAEYLDKETVYPADQIGIVPVYGYVSYNQGRMKYCGMGRKARHPQQAYNYHRSEMQAYMSQAPKAPWLTPVRAIQGLEPLWDRASVDSRAYLPYHDVDEQQQPIAAPSRTPLAVNLQNHAVEADVAKADIQAALGMYQANLGAPSNETSGVAIDARKQQGEAATAVFPAHLSASVAQVGRLCMQMIPRLIDTPRQLRILGIDMTPGKVTMNPTQPEAIKETPQGMSINPNVGQYDIRVVAGASFATQRTQAQQAFAEMMRNNPNMTPAIAPLWAHTLDVPYADKLAQVLTAVAPPEVKAILQPQDEGMPSSAELQAKLEQVQKALEEATNIAKEAQQELDECQAKLSSQYADQEAKEREIEIKAYQAETERLKVTGANVDQIEAIVMGLVGSMMRQPMPTMPEELETAEIHTPAQEAEAMQAGQEMEQEPMVPAEGEGMPQ